MALPVDEWPRREVLEAWNSPYFARPALIPDSSPKGRGETALLDEISRAAKVVKGLNQWREAFEAAKNRQEVDDPETMEQVNRLVPLQSLEALEAGFNDFVDLLTPPERASAREFVAFVEKIIGDDPALSPFPGLDTVQEHRLPFDQRRASLDQRAGGLNVVACARANPSTAERDVAALRAFKDVLRGLALAESVIGGDALTPALSQRERGTPFPLRGKGRG